MKRHRMVVMVLCLISVLFLAWYLGSHADPAYAEGSVAIPKSWGSCKGGVGGQLIFEDSSGTIRLVDARTGSLSITHQRE